MRVVCLLGSPRARGNSELLAEQFCKEAKSLGCDVKMHALRDLRFSGYQPPSDGIYASPDDDADQVLADVESSDILIFATPVYFCDITGHLKQAFDRFASFLEQDPQTGEMSSKLGNDKSLLFLQVQSEPAERHAGLFEHYRPAFQELGFSKFYHLRACGLRDERAVLKRTDIIMQAQQLARELVQPEAVDA
ncbi:MAG: flavodoxin family protein [Pseudomonadota bacterium]